MKLAIMQPYFFPYLGYFTLIKHTDKFIAFDPVQYIRKGWINRNRILKPGEGWQYIVAPVRASSKETSIKDIYVVEGEEWKIKIIRQLDHYKRKGPYYSNVINLLNDCFNSEETNLSKLNVIYLEEVCRYLQIPFVNQIYSEMNINVAETVHAADEWALRISEELGATHYYNPPGGVQFFNKEKYNNSNIDLKFIGISDYSYNQGRNSFEPHLSIIDVMMFNSPDQINQLLDNYVYV